MYKYEHASPYPPAAAEIYELGMCSALSKDLYQSGKVMFLYAQCFIMHTKYILVKLNFDTKRSVCMTGYGWLSVLSLPSFELKEVILSGKTNCFSSELSG